MLFTKLRDTSTTSEDFVKYSQRSMRLVAEDALAEFAFSTPVDVTTPCGTWKHGLTSIDPTNIVAVSIVRSGDALLDIVRQVEPKVRVGKILIQRDETTPEKTPTLFYSKLPPGIENGNMSVLLCDPMLATGT
jgi:uracil phosphoribosyltransferase